MTEHAGLPVSGYRAQSEANVARVNRHKELEELILRILDDLKGDPDIDQRWLAIGRTHIEEGFMAINRAVFKPERVKLREKVRLTPEQKLFDDIKKYGEEG